MNINDWIGTVGVFLILLAYFLNVRGLMSNKGIWFILLNLFGAGLAGLASWLIDYYPFVVLEGAWFAVTFYSLVKFLRNSNK